MANIVLLFACLVIGMVLHRTGKLPANAPATINGFIIHVSLPALILWYIHGANLRPDLLGAVAMPWLLFVISAVVFWCIGQMLSLSRGTTGALIMMGGLGNTSFIGLPMIESYYGPAFLPVGILIDQLGTYLVLSTLGITVACVYSEATASWREIVWRIATFPPLLAMLLALALLPVTYPEWVEVTLLRLGGTLAPLALVSVGLQLRLGTLLGNRSALAMGLGYKLLLGPLVLAAFYVAVLRGEGEILRVTVFEAAMAPQIGASIVAIQHGLNPPLVTMMVGIGTIASFITLPVWWYFLRTF
jgi:malate permease and related proteins